MTNEAGSVSPEPGRRSTEPRRTLVVLTAVLGLAATTTVFSMLRANQRDRVASEVRSGVSSMIAMNTSTLVSSFGNELARRFTALAIALTRAPQVSQDILDAHRWEVPSVIDADLPELFVNWEYLPRVRLSERAAFEERARAEGQPGFTILEPSDADPVSAADRDEYFPVLYESGVGRQIAPRGLDRYATPMDREAMARARDLGQPTAYEHAPFDENSGRFMVARYYVPLYGGGAAPTSVQERREALTGYLVAATYSEVEQWGLYVPVSIRGVEAIYFGGGDRSEPGFIVPELQRDFDQGRIVTTEYEMAGVPIRVAGRALPELVASVSTGEAWWALAFGLLGTAWATSLLLLMTRRSADVMRLVEERTDELRERTDALSRANSTLVSEVDERRRAEDALRESETRYRLLAENAQDVIYTHDLDFTCTYISPSVEQQRGFAPEEIIGKHILQGLSPDSRSHAERAMVEALKRAERDPDLVRRSRVTQMDAKCRDGSTVTIENRSSMLFDENGKPIGVLGVSRDISERKRVEKEKEELESRYRHAQKMEAIGTLAGGVAHDFNNLLTGILGYTELLKLDEGSGGKATRNIEVIEKAAKRAQELTSQLLGFARKGKYQSVAVDLNEAITDVTAFLGRTLDKNIEVEQRLSQERPWVLGDPSQIHQLLLNLAVNARDAMPSGGRLLFESDIVELDEDFVRTQVHLAPGTYNRIRVSDTGCGISSDKLDRIFEPYFTDKEHGQGTGMGLAMVYGVTKAHGGAVSVRTKEGAGSTFEILLPYSAPPEQEAPDVAPAVAVHGAGHVMLVDDEEVVRELAADMLEHLGYTVVTLANGAEAVDYYRVHWREIDLAIIDVIMPRMGGLRCLEALRGINPHVRAIMSTGYTTEEVTAHLADPGVVGLLQKPYQLHQLAAMVAEALGPVATTT